MEQIEKLKNAPLQEVAFEMRLASQLDDFGNKIDLGFEVAQGIFAKEIREQFPIHKKTQSSPQQISSFGTPIHQYWRAERELPLVQHGQGILSVHQDGTNYIWADFKKLAIQTIQTLTESYLNADSPAHAETISIDYLNAFDIYEGSVGDFIKAKLQTNVSDPQPIFGRLKSIEINRSYLQEDGSILTIRIQNAVKTETQAPAILLLISASISGKKIEKELSTSLEKLHTLCSQTFKNILNKSYYDELR